MDIINVNESFFERILQSEQKNDNLKVLNVSKKLATSKGDNFLSEIYRIIIKYTNDCENGHTKKSEETSLILKVKLTNLKIGADSIDEVFDTETKVFKNLLPKIEQYVGCSIGPHFYHSGENSNYIIMEDLTRLGYEVGNRFKGFTFDECQKALEKLAKFHAGSVIIAETEPQLLKCFDNLCAYGIFPKTFYKFLTSAFTDLSKKIAENWKEDEYQEIARKIAKMGNNMEMKVYNVFKHDDDEFCVLNHGDFWINNVMMQYNEKGNPCDARIVDYQLVTYTSPAVDLQHFLASCPELKVKGSKEKYFLEMYLTILTKTMKKLGCKTKPPSMEQLEESLRKRGIHSVIAGLIFYPRVLADTKDVEDFTDVMDNGDSKLDMFKNPLAVKIIRKFSKVLNDKGYLD